MNGEHDERGGKRLTAGMIVPKVQSRWGIGPLKMSRA